MYLEEKRAAFARAERLLANGDDEHLPYVCLELRIVLEAIAYSKLEAYSKRLPPAVLATWQPPQAVRALLEFEPNADREYSIAIAEESSPGVTSGPMQHVGTHRTIRVGRISKLYNKLGNMLHVPSVKERRESAGSPRPLAAKLRSDLVAMVDELRPVVDSHFEATIAEVFEFTCGRCDQPSVVNVAGARKSGIALCLNPQCGAEYFPEFQADDTIVLQPRETSFECHTCGKPMVMQNRHLEIGLRMRCAHCKALHTIATRQWAYGLLDEASETNNGPEGSA